MGNKARFAVLTDLHYFSPSLTDGGRAYQLRSGSDQKCLLESGAIIDKAFTMLAGDETIDSVLICGDITDDGETVCHEEMVEKLRFLNKYKNVYVITATHDRCTDGNAKTYFGDEYQHLEDTADADDMYKYYRKFGIDQAISTYKTHLGLYSYVVKLCDGFRLLGLNDDSNGVNGSGYSPEHMQWIVEQLQQAKKEGDRVVAMQHHVVLGHYVPFLTGMGICCRDREWVAETFASNGVEALFVGHSHFQNITEYTAENGNRLVQANIGSLVGHPGPIFKVNIDDDYISMNTEYVKEFTFEGKTYNTEYLYEHSKGVVANLLNAAASGDVDEFVARCGAMGIRNEKLPKLYFLIKKLARYITTVNVGSFAKTVNRLTFGKGIDKTAAKQIADKKVIDIAYEIFLNLFDGGINAHKKGTPTYTVVSDFISIPGKIVNKLGFVPDNVKSILTEITELVHLLMDDNIDNNYYRVRSTKLIEK